MTDKAETILLFLFLPAGLLAAWMCGKVDSLTATAVVCSVYGWFCMTIGIRVGYHRGMNESAHRMVEEIKKVTNAGLEAVRTSVVQVAEVVSHKIAVQLVDDLLVNPENDEQREGALLHAAAIVKRELEDAKVCADGAIDKLKHQ